MVALPLNADQPRNARRCADLGVARVVGAEECKAEAIRAATREVLHDPSDRANARCIRMRSRRMPGLDFAVSLLERLSRDKMPIPVSR